MIYFKLLATAVFWGGTFIAGRAIAGHVQPFAAAFLRFTLASFLLSLWLIRRSGHFPKVPRAQIVPLILLGLTGVFAYNTLFFKGLQFVPAGRASLIIANNPVWIAILSALLFQEKLGWVKSLGVVVSVTGAMIAISQGNFMQIWQGGVGWGDLYIAGCVFSWGMFTIIGKTVVAHLPPLVVILYASIIGAVALFPPAVYEGMFAAISSYNALDWFSLFYLGFFGTVLGFVWYYEGIERIGPVKAGLFINFVPLSAILMACFILSEPITLSLLVGAVFVITGVYLTNTGGIHLKIMLFSKAHSKH